MRGILTLLSLFHLHFGITPAHAGNTAINLNKLWKVQDHPRTCGEYSGDQQLNVIDIGSPPHMRGILKHGRHKCLQSRITPAHAGNTALHGLLGKVLQDHPRTCGEYLWTYRKRWEISGSPPHMRGLHHIDNLICRKLRITPAHAGNTYKATSWTFIE